MAPATHRWCLAVSCASSPSVVGPSSSSSSRRRWYRHHHHRERAARSHHAVASTSARWDVGARHTMDQRGDSIASRAMSMSSSSDENEELSLRNQFHNVSLNGGASASGSEDGSDVDGSAISRSRDDNNNNGTTETPTNSISSFMREGGVYNAQIGKEKPLKINQDLLIEEAKRIRNQSLYARTRKERKKLRDAAIETFKRAIAYDPSDGRAYVGMGKIYVQQKEFAKARGVYEYGTRATGSENAYLWQAFATLERKAGNVQEARKYFDAALVANPKHAAAWHGWGELERAEGNYQRARDLFLKGVMKVPKSEASAHLYQSLGLMAMERGRYDEARKHFRDGANTEKGAKSAAIWQCWGLLEAECGENERARQCFKRGLEVCPKSKYCWLAWGRFEASIGNIQRARELIQRGVRLNPADRSLLQALARLEANDGNIRVARQYFAAGTKLDPSHQQNWQAWGVAEFRAGNIEKARELFQRGVWVRPESKDAAVGLQAWAILERKEGNIPLARELFKCSVKANPTNSKSWMSWAQMEEEIDNISRASELRNLCAQERAEEAIGMTDLSPASLVGLDATIRPILKRLSSLLKGESSTGVSDTITRTDEKGDLYETDSFVWAGDELVFSNGSGNDDDDDDDDDDEF